MLKKVYERRACDRWNVRSSGDLLKLADRSERELYFFLTYAYMQDIDLSGILQPGNLTIRLIVALYTRIAAEYGYDCICDYYRQFIVIDESSEQAGKVIREIKMAEERGKMGYDR